MNGYILHHSCVCVFMFPFLLLHLFSHIFIPIYPQDEGANLWCISKIMALSRDIYCHCHEPWMRTFTLFKQIVLYAKLVRMCASSRVIYNKINIVVKVCRYVSIKMSFFLCVWSVIWLTKYHDIMSLFIFILFNFSWYLGCGLNRIRLCQKITYTPLFMCHDYDPIYYQFAFHCYTPPLFFGV